MSPCWDSGGVIYLETETGINIGCYLWVSSLVISLIASSVYLSALKQAYTDNNEQI